MAYDITQLKADLESIGHGLTINQVTNPNGMINRAARQLLLDLDPQETKRMAPLGTQMFQSVFDYPAPSDLKGNKIIDIFPQVNRNISQQYTQTYNEAFDVYKNQPVFPMFTIQFNTSVKTLRLANNFLITPALINQADQISDNGTWSVGGDANTLAQDNITFAAGSSSLRFDLSGSTGTGHIENSTMSQIDLSANLYQGTQFFWVYIPDPTNILSMNFRWGSSSSDYWEGTITTDYQGNTFQTGWNQVGVAWPTADTGTPNVAAVDYLKVTFTSTMGVAIPNVRINAFTSTLGAIWNIEYYSKYLFRDAVTGAFQETVTANSNLINLDTETYNVLTDLCALYMAQQQQGADSTFDMNFFKEQYATSLARYKGLYKSEIIKPKVAYYQRTSNSYRRWFGNGASGRGGSTGA